MTYVVIESCIKCKLMDCVEVCPVDCFYEGENMLVIDPDDCVDCAACEPVCPVNAIVPDTEKPYLGFRPIEKDGESNWETLSKPELGNWLEINTKYAAIWPNITLKREPPADAEEWLETPKKMQYFSPNPGKGD